MLTEIEHIHAILEDIAGQDGSQAAQVVVFILNRWFSDAGQQATLAQAITETEHIAQVATVIQANPSYWVANGRFNASMFDLYFLTNHLFHSDADSRDLAPLYTDLKLVLARLDTHYGQAFQVESARKFLQNIIEIAHILQSKFEQAK